VNARRFGLLATFLAAYLMSYFFRSTNAVLADDLQRDAGLGPEQLGVMTSLFFAVFAAAQLPLGAALDRFGPRFVPAGLMLAAAVGSLITANAEGFAGLAFGRAAIGLGMAGVLMGALKAFSAWFPPKRFATLSSAFVGIGSLGALGATTPLAALADASGWRGVFVAAALTTTVIAVALMIVVRAAPSGAPVVTAAAASGGASFRVIFGSGAFWRLALLVFALNGGLFAHQGLWAGPFLTNGLGFGAGDAARVLSLLAVSVTASFLVAGPLADRFGTGRMLIAGSLLSIAALSTLALLTPAAAGAAAIAFAAYGAGAGMTVLSYAHSRALFPTAAGRAVTAINLFAIGGSALLQAGLGWVIAGVAVALGGAAEGTAPLVAYRAGLFVTAALVAIGVVTWFVPTRVQRFGTTT
jgi:MFS family permease